MTIAFVQENYSAPSASSSVTVTFTSAQTAGNLNVIAIGWNDVTTTITSVTDSKGNSYSVAVPTDTYPTGGLSQAIYYAKNIASATANSNTVTVSFSASASFPDVRILEYSGLDTSSPLDTGTNASASGAGTTASVGPITTSIANELVLAAGMVGTSFSGPGTGYTSRVITSPNGDIVEDDIVSSAGSYSATAPLSSTAGWMLQMVAFKAAGAAPPPANGNFFALL